MAHQGTRFTGMIEYRNEQDALRRMDHPDTVLRSGSPGKNIMIIA